MARRIRNTAAAALLLSSATLAAPDLIVHNAKVTTFDGTTAAAFAVEDGRFSAVSADSEALLATADADTMVIDGEGRRVIPGINDSHLHVVRGGRFYDLETRWEGVRSVADGLALIRQRAEAVGPGEWVRVVGGWTPFQFEERRMPTPEELNAVAPENPVFVLFLYSGGLLNQAAMDALGIDRDSVAPKGSRYERDAEGNPTGRLIADPNPAILYGTIARLPQLSPEEQVVSSTHFYEALLELGVTSAIDAGGGGHQFPDDYRGSEVLAERGDLPLRVSTFLFPQERGRELAQFERWMASYEHDQQMDAHRHNGYVIEGGGELLVWSASDYENFTAERPELVAEADAELEAVVRLHVKNGWPFRIHATYDESISRMLNVLESVNEELPLSRVRWAFDHAETISDANLLRVKALGGGIAVQGRMAFAGEYFLERYGAEQTRRSPPIRRMLEMGIPVGLGTDGTRVASFNPWATYYWAVTGKTLGGTQLYGAENTVDRLTALWLFTSGSAWFSGEENFKGRIAPGMAADFAVLDRDILTVPPEDLLDTASVLTVVGGKVVFERPGASHYIH